jgi:hypothetical protein
LSLVRLGVPPVNVARTVRNVGVEEVVRWMWDEDETVNYEADFWFLAGLAT